ARTTSTISEKIFISYTNGSDVKQHIKYQQHCCEKEKVKVLIRGDINQTRIPQFTFDSSDGTDQPRYVIARLVYFEVLAPGLIRDRSQRAGVEMGDHTIAIAILLNTVSCVNIPAFFRSY